MRVSVPSRPTLGVLAWCAVAAWVACMAVEGVSWAAYTESGVFAPWACALAIAPVVAFGAAWALKRRFGIAVRSLAAVACAFAAASGCAGLFWAGWQADLSAVSAAASSEGLVCDLSSDASERDWGQVSVAVCRNAAPGASLRVQWPEDIDPLPAGHRIIVRGRLSAPGNDEGGRWNHQRGYIGTLSATRLEDGGYAQGLQGLLAPLRDAARDRLSGFSDTAASLLCGVLLGDRTLYAGSELEQDFRTTGLAHLMAVSGTHLAVVTALASWALGRARLPRAVRIACVLGASAAYVGLTCMAASAVRAFVMCAVASLSGLLLRRRHLVTALAATVLLFTCTTPSAVFWMGFQLSVLSVAGLAVLAPLARSWLEWLTPQRLAPAAEPVAATFAATVATMPATSLTFAQLPLISPAANLVAVPLVTVALELGLPLLLAAVAVPQASSFLLAVPAALAQGIASVVHALADLPGACVPLEAEGAGAALAIAAFAVALWAFWPQPPAEGARHACKRVMAAACFLAPVALMLFCGLGGSGGALVSLDPRPNSASQLVMLDVGQGDATLVRDGDAAVLVDTGEDDAALQRGLARAGATHLDAVFITHADADHCAALGALAGVVGVEHVFVHAGLVGSEAMSGVASDARRVTAGGGLEGVRVGDAVKVGRFTLTLLAPVEGGQSANEDSLVQLVTYDDDGDGQPEARGLLTGDAEAEAVADVVPQVGDIDFLKVAHHGSRGGSTAEQLAVMTPQIALIGVGADNSYGHPTSEMLSLLSACHAKVYRTDLDGDITLSFAGTTIGVSTQRT